VLILTGHSDPEKFARARALGAVDCFVKGPDLEPLLARVRALAGPPVGVEPADGPAPV
jgi:DNA-binding response OmpR family regulator